MEGEKENEMKEIERRNERGMREDEIEEEEGWVMKGGGWDERKRNDDEERKKRRKEGERKKDEKKGRILRNVKEKVLREVDKLEKEERENGWWRGRKEEGNEKKGRNERKDGRLEGEGNVEIVKGIEDIMIGGLLCFDLIVRIVRNM